MIKLIRFTEYNGDPLYVHPEAIRALSMERIDPSFLMWNRHVQPRLMLATTAGEFALDGTMDEALAAIEAAEDAL